ncbi:MAG TPA: M13 family metallopeptidase [Xanthobacteraceae bacterium]|nr:M13 family metallopeptidase [Xanthobacteraceae bacterium]
MNRKSVTGLIVVLLAAGAPPALAADAVPVIDPTAIDHAVSPCQNFYKFACGNWIRNNPIPPDRGRWTRFDSLTELNLAKLRGILEAAAAGTDPATRKVGDFYASCMDEAGIEAKGLAPLAPALARIDELTGAAGLPAQLAQQHQLGMRAFFSFRSTQDNADATKVIGEADQGGLGLPDRDYYLRTDEKSVELRNAYRRHVAAMFKLMGGDPAAAEHDADLVLAIETELAKASLDRVKRRDPKNLDHKLRRDELAGLAPRFAWDDYLAAVGQGSLETLNVGWPDFFKGFDGVLAADDPAALKAYLRWHLISGAAPLLPKAFVEERFNFQGSVLSGAKEDRPCWKRCVEQTNRLLGEELGRAYVAAYFGSKTRDETLAMVRSIEASYADDITSLDWMTPDTKAKALAKLEAIANKIGYPDKWRDYSALDIERGDALGNVLRAQGFEFRRQLAKIGKPVDRGEWYMPPPTVNAYYSSRYNDINFPAGILQPPFYDATRDAAANYGAIGSVMGHEMTHGFDDQGRHYDGSGNLKDWWTPADASAFEARAACLVGEYGDFTAVGDLKVNGRLTLGENIADNGGVRLSYAALEKALKGAVPPPVDGLSAPQRFFVAYAQSWCGSATEQDERRRALTDPHSPPEFRVNGVVVNQPEFAKAFSCPAGSPMAPPPEKICRVW